MPHHPEQVRFRVLIKDPIYRQYLQKRPTLDHIVSTAPWRVYVQLTQSGPWARKDFRTYPEAYRFLLKHYRQGAHDLSLGCKPRAFPLPQVKTKSGARQPLIRLIPDGHTWCGYCRRPTVFRYFKRHHALPKNYPPNPDALRCTICACRLEFLPTTRKRLPT